MIRKVDLPGIPSAMVDSPSGIKISLKEVKKRSLGIKPSFPTGIARPPSFPQKEVQS
jgi:hypothetical protein